MYTRAIRNDLLNTYAFAKGLCASKYSIICSFCVFLGFLRFNYPHDYTRPVLRTNFPGPQQMSALQNADAAMNVDAASRFSVSNDLHLNFTLSSFTFISLSASST